MFALASTLFLAYLMLMLYLATGLTLDDISVEVRHQVGQSLQSESDSSTLETSQGCRIESHSPLLLGSGGVVYNHLYCSVGDDGSVTVQADNVFSLWGDDQPSFLPTRPRIGLSLSGLANCCLGGLKQFLAHRLHGQPLAQTALAKAAQSFVGCDGDRTSAIVLALHGGSGTGKSYAARLLAEQLYWRGAASSCIRIIIPEQLTTATRNSSAQVQWVYLQSVLQNGVWACKHTLFILEEIEEMSRELLCLLFTLLRDPVRGAFYRKSLFLLISTVGDDYIWKATLEALEAGRSREEISIEQLERIIEETAGYTCEFDKRKGIGSIPNVVPFLPLEHHHVALCACDHLLNHGTLPNTQSSLHVADSIVSKSCRGPTLARFGCKNVPGQILLHLN
uniref:torsin-2A-like n=1 Tax=Myxine glutinosa TaxID=7769 RepID=UPI00358F4082